MRGISMAIESITYISTAAAKTDGLVLDAILVVSRRNNIRDGLSGMLIFDGVRFLQYLEGEAFEIDAALMRIRADERHRGLVVLARKGIERRQFGDWAMASRRTIGGESLADAVIDMTRDCDPTVAAELVSFVRLRNSA